MRIHHQDAYYSPKKPLIFHKGKCQLIAPSSKLYPFLCMFAFTGLSTVSLLKGIRSTFYLRLLPSLFYFSSFIYSSKLIMGQKAIKKHFISSMSLYENGRNVQVSFNRSTKPKDFDIKLFRHFTGSEKKFYKTLPLFKSRPQEYFTVVIDDRLYLLRKTTVVMNKEVLNAVLRGKYIKTKQLIQKESIVNL